MGLLSFLKPPDVDQMIKDKDISGLIKIASKNVYIDDPKGAEKNMGRRKAISALGKMIQYKTVQDEKEKVKITDALFGLVNDYFVGRNAISALMDNRTPDITKKIIAGLNNTENMLATHWSIIDELGDHRVIEAVEPLIALCESPNVTLRRRAVTALGKIGNARAVDSLSFATKDPDNEVRTNAMYALEKIKDPSAVEALEKAKRLLEDKK